MQEPDHRLIVVSNRLPCLFERDAQGQWQMQKGSGGLVTALVPVLQNRGGKWIGWTGTVEHDQQLDDLMKNATDGIGYELIPVDMSAKDRDLFYYGFSNEIIWPLFHDLQSQCNFAPEYWDAFVRINEKYAQAIIANCGPEDFIWVHDYHLMDVARAMREHDFHASIAFFLHIPFPPLDIFVKLPRRRKLLAALLQYDLIGFQTQRDRRNFVQCVRTLISNAVVKTSGGLHTIQYEGREVRVGAFPIGIDFNEFAQQAATEEVAQRAWNIHAGLPERQLILGVDRLDYTKGIPHRLEAIRQTLLRHPELERKFTFIQVAVPSRQNIPKYHALKDEIERMVGEINGQFTTSGWVPIHYIYRNLNRAELLAYYRTAEIALITPLKDGMNLVSKEYCACSVDQNSVLILSEFAGSAAQLHRGALLVNPYDVEEVAETILTAMNMDGEHRRNRMRRMRRIIRSQNIFWWVDSFIQAAISKDLGQFPVLDEYPSPQDYKDREHAEDDKKDHDEDDEPDQQHPESSPQAQPVG